MKKLTLSCITVLSLMLGYAQNENEITWFGLDFSKAKMVGSVGFTDPSQIQSYYLDQWNSVIVAEADKYNIAKYYKRPTVKNNLDVVKARNSKVVASTLVTDNTYTLSEADAQSVVKSYKGKGAGTGLLFVVESFSKTAEQASVYVILFDIGSGKVNTIKKQTGKASGFGFRNYWLGAITNVMKKGL